MAAGRQLLTEEDRDTVTGRKINIQIFTARTVNTGKFVLKRPICRKVPKKIAESSYIIMRVRDNDRYLLLWADEENRILSNALSTQSLPTCRKEQRDFSDLPYRFR